jgi:hypothetical protein
LKNIVVVSWYGEITLKILKEKPIKSIKKIISKGLLKTRSNFDSSKVDNYHLVKVSQKKKSHLT